MEGMFNGATAFNQDISSWDVSSVTTMESMFEGATAFNQWIFSVTSPTITKWDTSSVTTMASMFKNATAFDNGDRQSTWTSDVSNVTTMASMFEGATSFNRALTLDSTALENTDSMFKNATSYDTFAYLDISSLTSAANMFDGSGLSTLWYTNILNWMGQQATIQSGVTFGAASKQYTQTSVASGTNTTAGTPFELIDAGGGLSAASVDDIAWNSTENGYGKVTVVDSDIQLTLEVGVFASGTGKSYQIQSSNAAKRRYVLDRDNSWTITDGGGV
jgi:surface protein